MVSYMPNMVQILSMGEYHILPFHDIIYTANRIYVIVLEFSSLAILE